MHMSDWSSDVCSSDLLGIELLDKKLVVVKSSQHFYANFAPIATDVIYVGEPGSTAQDFTAIPYQHRDLHYRSEEHTSELQSLMRISYAVFCLKKKNHTYCIHDFYIY